MALGVLVTSVVDAVMVGDGAAVVVATGVVVATMREGVGETVLAIDRSGGSNARGLTTAEGTAGVGTGEAVRLTVAGGSAMTCCGVGVACVR